MLARRFLWIVTAIVLIVCAGALAYRLFAPQLMRAALVPSARYAEDRSTPAPDYDRPEMWIARPDLKGNPALWLPPGVAPGMASRASIFFIHPTSFLDNRRWNAPLDDKDSRDLAALFVRSQASAFNGVGEIWAPRYRQATIGALLTGRIDGKSAIDFAYRDVRAAFDAFLKQAPGDRPIILAAHSQGSYHLSRLLAERVAGTPLAKRIVAAYVIGWPLSAKIDAPRLGLPLCRTAEQAGCLLAWQSFAEPAEPRQLLDIYDASAGPNGKSRAGTPILCVNPITGVANGTAPAQANLGTLIPTRDLGGAALKPGLVPARCDAQGFLLIGEKPPDMPPYVLPGNNYHVFDYALFWANIRADAKKRLDNFGRGK